MKSRLAVRMRAPIEVIFPLAADVERWPERLAHYRFVRRVADPNGERRFAMGARRGPIPVRWEAVQRPMPDARRIEFVHTGGVTRGMRVAWTFTPEPDGVTLVAIEHELELAWPVLGHFAAERVIGPQFIEPIAHRTLRRIRDLAEADA
ncbi:MAG TPA: SRPBCC family protein [Candidatus Limnocylindria bacterium]|nr:SRPBCC family protein [Candidatus Limnocylindria bacterium]